MRIVDGKCAKFQLWFPLFILWPLALPFLLLTVIAALFADLFSLISLHKPGYTRFLFGVLGTVSETRGTEVFIQDKSHHSRIVAFTLR
ncbi:MAG: hypothetical protein A2133_00725 [Actinobacteria bacterium RBG_16_64_13]|nr:MAG: hypothetical protein A2133_00725 [Actinobacteria bacterium RBG_16_64_13]